jgi:hypothetical protein
VVDVVVVEVFAPVASMRLPLVGVLVELVGFVVLVTMGSA